MTTENVPRPMSNSLSIQMAIQVGEAPSCPLSPEAAAVQNEAVSEVGIYSRNTSQKTEPVIGQRL